VLFDFFKEEQIIFSFEENLLRIVSPVKDVVKMPGLELHGEVFEVCELKVRKFVIG
jgi:hypothetical protein